MHNPLQEVLIAPSRPADDDLHPEARSARRVGVVFHRFGGRLIGLSLLVGFSLAIAAVSLLPGTRRYAGGIVGFLSAAGLGLMVWAAATLVFLLAVAVIAFRYAPRWRFALSREGRPHPGAAARSESESRYE